MSAPGRFLNYLIKNDGGRDICDKQNPLAEFYFRFDAYAKLLGHFLQAGIPLSDIIRSRLPFRFPFPEKPSMLSLEFCNHCNLECSYCFTGFDKRPKGNMSKDVLADILKGIGQLKINRVHLRGWGEPTLHPVFGAFLSELGRVTKYLDIVTNGQWDDEAISQDMLKAPLRRIDISIKCGGKEIYEKERNGGSYEKVEKNLKRLRNLRDRLKLTSIILVRLMFRPSQVNLLNREKAFWRQFADAVIPAPIFQKNNLSHSDCSFQDMYTLSAALDEYPRCPFPFNELYISWDGTVPLCDKLILSPDYSGDIIGNIKDRSLKDFWDDDKLINLRRAHKRNWIPGREVCRGCTTC